MTKADIALIIQDNTNLSKKESSEMMEAVFSIMKQTLGSGEKLKISGFGKFEVKQKNGRRGRNPQTGETIMLEPRRVLIFKPSQTLRQAINGAGD